MAIVDTFSARNLASRVERQLDMGDVVAAVRVGHEAFRALGGPFDRLAHLAGGPGDDRLLGVMVDLRAEAAADIGRDDAQPRLRDVQHEGAHQQPDHVRVLAGRIERVLAGRAVELADRGARLHRVRHEPVVDEVELDDPRRLGDRGIDRGRIAEVPVVADIAGRLVGQTCGAPGFSASAASTTAGSTRVVDRDLLGGVARLPEALGDHHRDRIADMAHPVDGEHRMRRLLHRRAVLRIDQPAAGQPADAVGRHVLAGEDGDDAGRRGARRWCRCRSIRALACGLRRMKA